MATLPGLVKDPSPGGPTTGTPNADNEVVFTDQHNKLVDIISGDDTSKIPKTALESKITTRSSLQNTKLISTNGLLKNSHILQSHSLLTYNNNQYVGFYNSSFQIVLQKYSSAGILLEENTLTTKTTDGLDNHDHISMEFDSTGILHVSYDLHATGLKYFKMPTSESVLGTAGSNISMLGTNETQVTYPTFIRDNNNKLYFIFRDGISGNGDVYMYEYNTSTSTWSAATGTSTAGLLAEGKTQTPDVNAYWSRPYIDSSNVMHFMAVWRETPDAQTNFDPFYFSYDGTAFKKAGGTSQTTPIVPSNADTIISKAINNAVQGNLQVRATYKDSSGNLHVILQYDDSNAVIQLYHAKYTTSWTINQISNYKENPDEENNISPLLVDSKGTFYVLHWHNSTTFALLVYESTDNGTTWSEPYPISDSFYQRASFNIDYAKWDSSSIFNRTVQYIINENNNALMTSIKRYVFVEQWDPLGGKSKHVSGVSGLQAIDDINIHSIDGTVNIGVSDSAKIAAKFNVGNSMFNGGGVEILDTTGGKILLGNAAGNTTHFTPTFAGFAVGDNTRATLIKARVTAANDTGTSGALVLDSERDTPAPLTSRALLDIRNNNVTKFTVNADGSVNFYSKGVENLVYDANGTGNTLSNVDVADLAAGTDGELITWDASGNPTTVPVGTATHVLTSNGVGTAPTFQANPAGFADPMTTRGDLIYKNAAGTTVRLPAGTVNQVIVSDGTDIAWGSAGAGDMILASAQTNTGIKTFLDTTMKLRNVANTFDGYFVNTNTADRVYTLPDTAGTIALTSDLTGKFDTAGTGLTSSGTTVNAIGTLNRITVNANDIDIASTYVGQTSITTLGTIATGTWQGTTIAVNQGGTGVTTKTGTGNVVLSTSPTLVTPVLGTPASGVATNLTGTASGLTAGNVTTNANLTGDVTSVGNATTIAAKAVDVAMLADGTDGELITWSATGVATTVAVGTATHVLTSNGVGVAPTFQVAASGGAGEETFESKQSGTTVSSVSFAATITARQRYRLVIRGKGISGGVSRIGLRFNADTGANYGYRMDQNQVTKSGSAANQLHILYDAANDEIFESYVDILKDINGDWVVVHTGNGHPNSNQTHAGFRRHGGGRWNGGVQITSIDVVCMNSSDVLTNAQNLEAVLYSYTDRF